MSTPDSRSPQMRWSLGAMMGFVLFWALYNAIFLLLLSLFFRPRTAPLTNQERVAAGAFWNVLLIVPLAIAALIRSLSVWMERRGVVRRRRAPSESTLPGEFPFFSLSPWTVVWIGIVVDFCLMYLLFLAAEKSSSNAPGRLNLDMIGLAVVAVAHVNVLVWCNMAFLICFIVRAVRQLVRELARSKAAGEGQESRNA